MSIHTTRNENISLIMHAITGVYSLGVHTFLDLTRPRPGVQGFNFSVILSCHAIIQLPIRTANQIPRSYKNDQSNIFVTVYCVT